MEIAKVIKAHGLSQMEVAQRMGISRQGLANALQRDEAINFKTLRAIADAVGCSVVEFFADEAEGVAAGAAPCITCPNCGQRISITASAEE